jgi:uncharacterized membrane protein YdjX (TVP38/TMEM64 family)
LNKSRPEKPLHRAWLWVGLAVIAALFAFLLLSPAAKSAMETATLWAEGVMEAHPMAGAVVFFLMSAVSPMLAFASSTVLVPPANLVWGKVVTFFLLWGGWVAGIAMAYAIGYLARPMLIRMGYGEKLAKYREFASKRLKFWQLLLFCFAVPSEIPGYLFGGVHYFFWKFLAAMAIAEGVYAAGVVIAGDRLVAADPRTVLLVVGALVLIGLAARFLLRIFGKRKNMGV